MFELFDAMDNQEKFVEQAMTLAGGRATDADGETEELEIVMEWLGRCTALEDFFGRARLQKLWKHQVSLHIP